VTAEEARWIVASAFRAAGAAVYEGRSRPTSLPDLVVMDATTGASARVRVQTGKRPKGARRMAFDRRRVGAHADVLALVDPRSGAIDLRTPTPGSGLEVARGGETPRRDAYRTVGAKIGGGS
jgi:hypothetical protein